MASSLSGVRGGSAAGTGPPGPGRRTGPPGPGRVVRLDHAPAPAAPSLPPPPHPAMRPLLCLAALALAWPAAAQDGSSARATAPTEAASGPAAGFVEDGGRLTYYHVERGGPVVLGEGAEGRPRVEVPYDAFVEVLGRAARAGALDPLPGSAEGAFALDVDDRAVVRLATAVPVGTLALGAMGVGLIALAGGGRGLGAAGAAGARPPGRVPAPAGGGARGRAGARGARVARRAGPGPLRRPDRPRRDGRRGGGARGRDAGGRRAPVAVRRAPAVGPGRVRAHGRAGGAGRPGPGGAAAGRWTSSSGPSPAPGPWPTGRR